MQNTVNTYKLIKLGGIDFHPFLKKISYFLRKETSASNLKSNYSVKKERQNHGLFLKSNSHKMTS
jgi:hypothetical protein